MIAGIKTTLIKTIFDHFNSTNSNDLKMYIDIIGNKNIKIDKFNLLEKINKNQEIIINKIKVIKSLFQLILLKTL